VNDSAHGMSNCHRQLDRIANFPPIVLRAIGLDWTNSTPAAVPTQPTDSQSPRSRFDSKLILSGVAGRGSKVSSALPSDPATPDSPVKWAVHIDSAGFMPEAPEW